METEPGLQAGPQAFYVISVKFRS